jgi:hypothetical protein
MKLILNLQPNNFNHIGCFYMLRKFTTFITIGAICTLDLFNLKTEPILAQTAPDTCIQGYVWREATPNDRVCVTPEIRTQTAEDNSAAASRIDPVDRTYGPFTCVQGYVWREAMPNDLVCVTPEVRSQTASDNSLASSRIVQVRTRVRTKPGVTLPVEQAPPTLKRTIVPGHPGRYTDQFLGISRVNASEASSNAIDRARNFLGGKYTNRNLELNFSISSKDEGFDDNNQWVSWVIIQLIATKVPSLPEDCPQPANPDEGQSCSPQDSGCYFKDPRNCRRKK